MVGDVERIDVVALRLGQAGAQVGQRVGAPRQQAQGGAAGGIEGIRVRVERNEHVGVIPAGHLEPRAQRHEFVGLAGHLDPVAPGGQELALQFLGHGQGGFFGLHGIARGDHHHVRQHPHECNVL